MYTTFLFDLDGTLTDPKEGIVNSVLFALRKMGIDEPNPNELDSFIGPPIQHSFADRYGMNEKQVEQAVTYFREYMQQSGLFENKVYEGIPCILQELKDEGMRLFVATSKLTVFAKQVLEHFQLTHFFEEIVGSNLDGTRIKKDEIIEHILHTNKGLQKEEIVMVGDRKYDMIGANCNGIDSIGLLYGYGSEGELKEAGATHIVKHVEELRNFYVKNKSLKI
ncbi:phosphoglycolate phosphatase [Bacillus pseudomycoides]|uniref:Phosphoglycolate phosphatase n=1 Tax=Bacillus pseudomycoides TaxID=64104 RepID=A0AA91VCT9_9BACI|nr:MULTISPECIES: HAD family hydrolase [Bacillus]PEB51254.1 phosphoglycolate phosphatase [Bacillus sp. AFS098217]PED82921.1 phosphoglycolate phosphatase [Bacillus pseudomycoides]PEU05305.1 phosphoglycolate phosphatase [Bacillus sp. AFS019443]PEU08976.1 phosphoglycolate phosphatase [Bacillus sp. AFS014408]PFW65224.1 phosphoglycolate phosphatase [Bacillus sp. AFS075034]